MQIILASGSAPLSKLIMALSGGRFSHTAIRYGSVDSDWLVHAFIYGVTPEWHSYFITKYKFIKSFEIIKNKKDAEIALDEVVKKYRHKKYDFIGLFGYFIVSLFEKVKIKIRTPFQSRNSLLCTELVAEFLKTFSVSCNLELPDLTQFSTPKMIEELLESRSDIFKKIEVIDDSK
jgi:hypothetical protein